MIVLKPEGFHLDDVAAQPVAVCGRQMIADNSGALYWPGQRTLLVADLPLGNGSVPGSTPGAARRTLIKLAEVMDRYEPARVIAFGAGVDANGAGPGIAAGELEILRILQEDRQWIWLTAPADPQAAPQIGGSARGELEISGITLRHRPSPGWATQEIAAHLHPAARLSMYGYSIRRACFVGNGRRLVMPAFGASRDGRNVLDDAFRPLFGHGGMAVWMLGQEGLYPVAARYLAAD